MSLLERIRDVCDQKSLSFHAVEKLCGFGNGTIKRWDTQIPSVEKVSILADVLNISIDYLVYGETQKIGKNSIEEDLLQDFRKLSFNGQKEVAAIVKLKIGLENNDDFTETSSTLRNGNGGTGGNRGPATA